MKWIFLILIFSNVSLASPCANLLTTPPSRGHGTTADFIIYLERLLEAQIIGDHELQRIVNGLENDVLENPISEIEAQQNSNMLVHRQELEKYILLQIDRALIGDWAKRALREKARTQIIRSETRKNTESLYRRMEFHSVQGGELHLSAASLEVKAFELMSTPVTQHQWITLMEYNPSSFAGEELVLIGDKEYKAQPNNPVESIDHSTAALFAAQLNSLSLAGDPRLDQIIIGHKRGDTYRLPTQEEWMYVASDRGRAISNWFFGEDSAQLEQYAWVMKNSDLRTHPVGDLKPLVVDGKQFFDIYGNVDEWVESGFQPMAVGGSVFTDFPNLFYRYESSGGATTGFRLVRIREP